MAKGKKTGRPTPPRRLVEGTFAAYELLENGETAEALEILVELNQEYPNSPEVLGNLVNAYFDLQDLQHYEHAVRQLARLKPRDADLRYGLAGAYLVNNRPALSLQTFKEALQRWPDHSRAEEARNELPRLESILQEQAAELGMDEAQALDLMTQHDELRYCLAHAEYRQGRLAADKLLRSYPDFVPALNNLTQIHAIEGNFEHAIHTAQRVQTIEPENIHALSNLARLYFLIGDPDQAALYAQQLKDSRGEATDRWTKIAEALTFLEDDAGVLELYDRAKAAEELEPPKTDALFYHLLAAAAMHQGKEKAAQQYWKKALQIDPHFKWASENLEDQTLPPEERSGVWAFPFENWLLGAAVLDLAAQLEKMKRTAKKADVQKSVALFFEEKHPEVFFLAPHMVARGDSRAREFVARTAAVTGHPALVAAAKAYVFGKRGLFQERLQAAQMLSEAELLPSGPAKFWSGEEQREIMLLNIEISPEPDESRLPKRARLLAEQAFDALQDGDGPKAQALLEQALAIAPDDPSLINNLAMAFEMQDQDEKAHQIIQDVHARFPDYLFGIIAAASLDVIEGNLERAHDLLNGLLQRKKMHTSEFNALCRAQTQVWLADKNREAARTWLNMWEQVDPENPDITLYRMRIGPDQKKAGGVR